MANIGNTYSLFATPYSLSSPGGENSGVSP
jgi:hypothetical protein